MRKLTAHIVEGDAANHQIDITAHDGHGQSGRGHVYVIGADLTENPGFLPINPDREVLVLFQNGPIAEAGVNGVTNEALLAILIDRTEAFQDGPYACAENAEALTGLRTALTAFQIRTRRRIAAGIEGTHEPDSKPGVADDGVETDPTAHERVPQPIPAAALPHIPVDETLAQMDDDAVAEMAIAHGVTEIGERDAMENFLRVKRDGAVTQDHQK